jgi:hypothetical protein
MMSVGGSAAYAGSVDDLNPLLLDIAVEYTTWHGVHEGDSSISEGVSSLMTLLRVVILL